MKRIIFIAQYLLSFPGGAERSIFAELKNFSKTHEVIAYTFDSYYPVGEHIHEGIKVHNFGLKKTFGPSRFIEHRLNKKYIDEKLSSIEFKSSDRVLTQTLIVPIIAKFCIKKKLKYTYYLRDENQLNVFNNYQVGMKYFLKEIKDLVEYPLLSSYKKSNEFAIKKADKLIVNSKYMQKLLSTKFKKKSTVVFPKINKERYAIELDKSKQEYISFFGVGNSWKGEDIAYKIAKKMPNHSFLFVSQFGGEKHVKGNITFHPPFKDPLDLFRLTKVLIVPSRFEAYCRIVAESALLNIPSVTSNRGGLPESNPRKKLIVGNYNDIDEWVKKLELALKEK